jgi:hypothetical protein
MVSDNQKKEKHKGSIRRSSKADHEKFKKPPV